MRLPRLVLPAALLVGLLAVTSACGTQSPPMEHSPLARKPVAKTLSYVALGDSYTAGPGIAITDANSACFRSDHNYPSLIATARPDLALSDQSCSGARTSDLTGPQRFGGTAVPAQLEALTPQTDVVTLGIGGNDGALFAGLVGKGALMRGDQVSSVLRTTRASIVAALREIHRRAPRARVFVIGYPAIVPTSNSCPDLPALASEVALARQVETALNTTLRSAALEGRAKFVDVAAATKGHEICSSDPWINGANQADQSNAAGNGVAFHPREAEQQVVARLVLAQLPASQG